MEQVPEYEALIRELLAGVAGGWSYGNVIVLLMTKGVDETDLALWLREFAEGLSLERDRELIEQLKLLGEMTQGKLASEALSIIARVDSSDLQGSESIDHENWFDRGHKLFELGRYDEAISSYDRAIEIHPNDYRFMNLRGTLLSIVGKYEEAISSYDQSLKIKFNDYLAWSSRGRALSDLGKHKEAVSSFDKSLQIQPDDYQTWIDRGHSLCYLHLHNEAIISFDRAIIIDPENDDAWYQKGLALKESGDFQKAIFSFDKVTKINPDDCRAWQELGALLCEKSKSYDVALRCFNRILYLNPNDNRAWYSKGLVLTYLERQEEAISSFERVIKIEPDNPIDWTNRGIVLSKLNRYEAAITCYEKAVEIQPDHYEAWVNKGVTLNKLERYEAAILTYKRAIEIQPNDYRAWHSQGITLIDLKKYQEAISSYDLATEINPDHHEAWFYRGVAVRFHKKSYRAEIDAYNEAFQHIHSDTHSEGYGFLQRQIGRTYYEEGINQLSEHHCDPQPYYDRALPHYHNALTTLTREEFPKLRLDTLIDTAKVYLAQHNAPAAHQCKTEAFEIFQNLLNAQTPEGKKRLQREYHSLSQLDVDLFIANGDNANALVAAELEKNNRLTWLLTALSEKTISPSYVQMRQLLGIKSASTTLNIRGLDRAITLPLAKNSPTGIIYWHLSPDNLTTFILTANDSQPLVWESDRRQQAQQLAKWIKEWDTQYRDYGSKKSVATQPSPDGEVIKDEKEHHPWRKNLPDYLEQLQQILEIDKICAQLPTTLTHLILIPHGDLHRFPLHTLFLTSAKLPNLQSCTYLPSIQIGLNLQQRSNPTKSYTPLLSVEDPETHQAEMPFAQIESTIVRHLLQPNTHINSVSADLATVENALKQPHASFHFTGHAAYNSRSPEASALALTDEPLTAKRISQLDLSSYNLITLAACETAITGRENINTEYVGLSSAFLQAGAANILSTLWQVDEIANAWFTIYFYQQLLSGKSPAEALAITQRWLQAITWQSLADWLTEISQLPQLEIGIIDRLTARITNTLKEGGTIGLNIPTKYSHPYYWAAFTLTGEG